VALVAQGKMLQYASLAKRKTLKCGIDAMLINACFAKPIDKFMIDDLIKNDIDIVTIEDNILRGGLGSYILEYINNVDGKIRVLNLGFKDEFIQQGKPEIIYKLYGLDAEGIKNSVLNFVNKGVKYVK
jgi:1-deoxy-D-xylulose-5-phosphate synthase